jgi:DNA-binding PadR family transcriptional regulator
VPKRKVDNLLALAVLACAYERPMHPYEMATLIRDRGKDRQLAVKWGSLYTVVQNLEKHGLLEAAGTSREGARPARTIYRITEAGRQELRDWTRELVGTPQQTQTAFVAGLSVLAVLPPSEAIGLLRRRAERVEELVAKDTATLAELGRQVPRLFLVEDEYALAVLRAEAEWLTALLADLTSGRFPGLDGWQAAHDSNDPADRTHREAES